jgi:hypothetical protein
MRNVSDGGAALLRDLFRERGAKRLPTEEIAVVPAGEWLTAAGEGAEEAARRRRWRAA